MIAYYNCAVEQPCNIHRNIVYEIHELVALASSPKVSSVQVIKALATAAWDIAHSVNGLPLDVEHKLMEVSDETGSCVCWKAGNTNTFTLSSAE
ncbi:hypothetical protein [Roseivivax isoporae]|uniref:hypothetical protein n=1 Tax=Roseivivax isoporae TaxID=591206 RepID=UPI0012EBD78F|nr:hypothetical protein [Roseivivax isoporae]